ncbi:unnamed protein product [Acanthosepion pharaonis]|uniref:Transmembrane protein n=1 Tax=Acanthosepion pharaonis TaxID=158019 RepID=A0A812BAV1_ACAPH|nr:unnamed protein product [Sepia pharaonis]
MEQWCTRLNSLFLLKCRISFFSFFFCLSLPVIAHSFFCHSLAVILHSCFSSLLTRRLSFAFFVSPYPPSLIRVFRLSLSAVSHSRFSSLLIRRLSFAFFVSPYPPSLLTRRLLPAVSHSRRFLTSLLFLFLSAVSHSFILFTLVSIFLFRSLKYLFLNSSFFYVLFINLSICIFQCSTPMKFLHLLVNRRRSEQYLQNEAEKKKS